MLFLRSKYAIICMCDNCKSSMIKISFVKKKKNTHPWEAALIIAPIY